MRSSPEPPDFAALVRPLKKQVFDVRPGVHVIRCYDATGMPVLTLTVEDVPGNDFHLDFKGVLGRSLWPFRDSFEHAAFWGEVGREVRAILESHPAR